MIVRKNKNVKKITFCTIKVDLCGYLIRLWKQPKVYGPVVQLNRTSDSGSESRGFESRRGYKD